MVIHRCEKCNKEFEKKSTYDNHLKRKNSCIPPPNKMKELEDDIKELQEKLENLFKKLNYDV